MPQADDQLTAYEAAVRSRGVQPRSECQDGAREQETRRVMLKVGLYISILGRSSRQPDKHAISAMGIELIPRDWTYLRHRECADCGAKMLVNIVIVAAHKCK